MNSKHIYFILLLTLVTLLACTSEKHLISGKEYRKSKPIVTYCGMANELQDGCLVLKENGYFSFRQKLWLIITINLHSYKGKYTQEGDTVYLKWNKFNPKTIWPFLSNKCFIDSVNKSIWFIEEGTNEKLWGAGLKSKY